MRFLRIVVLVGAASACTAIDDFGKFAAVDAPDLAGDLASSPDLTAPTVGSRCSRGTPNSCGPGFVCANVGGVMGMCAHPCTASGSCPNPVQERCVRYSGDEFCDPRCLMNASCPGLVPHCCLDNNVCASNMNDCNSINPQ